MKRLYDFSEQKVIITGAASGIGLEIAKSFLEADAYVAILDINRELLEAAAKELSVYEERAWLLECDITNKETLQKVIHLVLETWKTVHILVNNAGIITRTSLEETTDEVLHRELEVDFFAPYRIANMILPSMIKEGGGKIINMCSIMSEYVRENTAGYASCKGALKMLTRGMACDWGKYNIQCNGVAPGYIETEQTAPIRENDHEFYEFIKKRTIAKRWGSAKDISGAVLFLASEDADYITGQMITVDGGMSIYIYRRKIAKSGGISMDNYIITIARGYGSGGSHVGKKLSEMLGIPCYDTEILDMASELSGINVSYFYEANEKINKGQIRIRNSKGAYTGRLYAINDSKYLSNENMFNYQAEVIKSLALGGKQSCIIIGKAANKIIGSLKNVVTVNIQAPLDVSIENIVNRLQVNTVEAKEKILQTNKYRANYYRYYTGGTWNDSTEYELTINPGAVGEDYAAEMIVNYLKHKELIK